MKGKTIIKTDNYKNQRNINNTYKGTNNKQGKNNQ